MILNVDFALKLRNNTPLKRFMAQMNPKKFLHNSTFSVQLPYIAGHSLKLKVERTRQCLYL